MAKMDEMNHRKGGKMKKDWTSTYVQFQAKKPHNCQLEQRRYMKQRVEQKIQNCCTTWFGGLCSNSQYQTSTGGSQLHYQRWITVTTFINCSAKVEKIDNFSNLKTGKFFGKMLFHLKIVKLMDYRSKAIMCNLQQDTLYQTWKKSTK